jgi:hypothetical protein
MTLGQGAYLIAVLSTGMVSLLCCIKRPAEKLWHLLTAIVVPFLLANGLYWHGAWQAKEAMGSTAFGEYEMWAPLFLVPWFIAGVIPSVAAVLFLRVYIRKMAQVELPSQHRK